MSKLSQLKQTADEALGGLVAGPALFERARQAANRPAAPKRSTPQRILAFAMSLALVLGLSALALPQIFKGSEPSLTTMQMGQETPPGAQLKADLPRGSLQLSTADKPAFQGVFMRGSGANFPLIRVDGRWYRLLTHPSDVKGLLGPALGQVEAYNEEPALDLGGSILSNIAPLGSPVYSIRGMGNSVVAAEFDGNARLFQRVSFAGEALIGSEGLADVLPAGASALQISGLGTIKDPGQVQSLLAILHQQSSRQGNQLKSSDQALLVQYPNGIVLQWFLSGDKLSACGTYASPAFIKEFERLLGQE